MSDQKDSGGQNGNPNNGKQNVVIDLRKSRHNRELTKQEIIHQDALKKLDLLISDRLSRLSSLAKSRCCSNNSADNTYHSHRHQTIVIHGGRGSGKTTFIINALDLFSRDAAYKDKIGDRLAILEMIDPTLMEKSGNILVNIINLMRMAVEKARVSRCRTNDGYYDDWQKKLHSLASGLSLLDGNGPVKMIDDNWNDASFVLNRGLDKAKSGFELERSFHNFIKSTLEYLSKDAFLLAIDDVDTDFQRAWPVLEMLRRYLTSPRLIIVLSGDMDLYAMAVRGQQWNHFSERHLKYDENDYKSQREMVDHLQSQFLLKVLPTDKRVCLSTLESVSRTGGTISVIPRIPDNNDNVDKAKSHTLNDYLEKLVLSGLGFKGNTTDIVKSLLLRQPLRTVLDVLNLPEKLIINTNDRHIDQTASKDLADGLGSVFIDVLLRHHTTLDDLYQATGDRTIPYIAEFLTNNGLWERAHDLVPGQTDDDPSLVLMTIGTWVREQWRGRPYLAVEYMLKICFSHELMTSLLQKPSFISSERNRSRKIDEFVKFTELNRSGTTCITVAHLLISVINGVLNTTGRLGTVRLRRAIYGTKKRHILKRMYGESFSDNNPPSDDNPIFPYYKKIQPHLKNLLNYEGKFNSLDIIRKSISMSAYKSIVVLPASKVLRLSGESHLYYSIHSIIGFISDIMRLASLSNYNNDCKSIVVGAIRNISMVRFFPTPPWIDHTENEKPRPSFFVIPKEEMNETNIDNLNDDLIIITLTNWLLNNMRHEYTLPSYVLGRIWSRFYFTLVGIDDDMQMNDRYLGHILHRHIIAFFNAILVEEGLYNGVEPKTYQNPVRDDSSFDANLVAYRKAHDVKCHFFEQIFYCPLWSVYLDTNSNCYKDHKIRIWKDKDVPKVVLALKGINKQVEFDNLYALLNSVPLFMMKEMYDKDGKILYSADDVEDETKPPPDDEISNGSGPSVSQP